mmetsp:Transcript_29786/g.50040  ORF Transcript_29786/g.50040 Transcript_29786/m.50040 type:complete len:261 (+) Transcript_29786:354-1136(+)
MGISDAIRPITASRWEYLAPSRQSHELDDSGGAHTRPDAHGDDAKLATCALELWQQRGHLSGPGCAERVAEGDGPALGVELRRRDAELVDTIGRLRSERLVHLKDVDVRNTQPHLLEGRRDGDGGANAHDLWRAPDHGVGAEHGQHRQPVLRGKRPTRKENTSGAVCHLARVAGGGGAGFLEDSLELSEGLRGEPRPHALVHAYRHHGGLAVLVLHRCCHRHDLFIVITHVLCPHSLCMRVRCHLILHLAGDAPLGRNVL